MSFQYVIQPGDTFEKIAQQFYNTPELGDCLRRYNGLCDAAFIIIGQPIDIPHSSFLTGLSGGALRERSELPVPRGLQQMIAQFGNIFDFIRDDGFFDEPRWITEALAVVELPFPVALSWNHGQKVRCVRCHRKLKDLIGEAFHAVEREGLAGEIITIGDFYNFRSRHTRGKLSTHCWGIAFDLNPEINSIGSAGCMPQQLVDIFGRFGFSWGGDSIGRHREPMHFQYCLGY